MDITHYSHDLLAHLFQRMTLVREFELRAIEERRRGLIPGFIHSCVGQEATAVAACAALAQQDVITSTHRGHGHLLGKGGDPKFMMAELAGRSSGYCLGRGGSLHIADFDLGILGANGIVGGGFPIATGAALAFQMRREQRVALAFFGDGAINEGTFHESANLAGLWKLPVIFFCENNLYGEGTPQHKQAPIADLARRADSYGFPGVSVDGNDPIAVYEATQAARRRALAGDGPTLIEAKTYRFRGHYEGDPQVYREPGEMAAWRQRDPVPAFRARLLESGLFDEAQLVEMETAVQTELDVAVAFAAAAPLPVVDEALQGIYAETHEGLVF
ncbi:MAG: thiamine pyrophosphate-dependent dehydrogenase E1 component subunit alpha [Ardenticatenaceae bacterium]|nr:thiamine pyrophosphate-dependent dehydrogenase E1 component subunit alpha [Anaerolineales bacterium]MCB8921611.1 thiamine pyrophosphate-dependent dehydrogenase E1 component subunit alpha [Ardenticatenaceae bacterium]